MTYGLGTRAPAQYAPAKPVPERAATRSWSALSETCRLALIEQALRPAIDGFPLAL